MSNIYITMLAKEILELMHQPEATNPTKLLETHENYLEIHNKLETELTKYIHNFKMGVNYLTIDEEHFVSFQLLGDSEKPAIRFLAISTYQSLTQIHKLQNQPS